VSSNILTIPTRWLEGAEECPEGWLETHAPGLLRVWPVARESVNLVCRTFGCSYKLLVQRMEREQSACSYAWDGSTRDYRQLGDLNGHFAALMIDQGVDTDVLVDAGDRWKLFYLCGVDKTNSGPRPDGWFGPLLQLAGVAARFCCVYQGKPLPEADWLPELPQALRGYRMDRKAYAAGIPYSGPSWGGKVLTPANDATAWGFAYMTSPNQELLRTIAERFGWAADYEADVSGQSPVSGIGNMTDSGKDAKMDAPRIVDCRLKFPRAFQRRTQTDRLMVHHSASADGDAPTFHQWHLGQGWNGIGYHAVICKDGTIQQGRPFWAVSANTMNHNYHTIGVNLVGDFTSHQPTEAQVASLIKLLAWLCQEWNLKPGNILGHRDLNSTSCPGDSFYPRLPEIRRAVGTMLGQTPSEDGVPFVRFGDNDKRDGTNEVARVQAKLNLRGYNLEADGDCGRLTLEAITDFQVKHGLEPDGVVGPLTWSKLSEA
jgi:hypothetical protein